MNNINERYRKILIKYIPERAIDPVISHIIEFNIFLKISKTRQTKLGDFRPCIDDKTNHITVNHNLNQYAFLITLIHEIAHASTFKKHFPRRISPHGVQWKGEFTRLMYPMIMDGIFPPDVQLQLAIHMKNPKASSSADTKLIYLLSKYDTKQQKTFLVDIPDKSKFTLGGRTFIKGEQLRKRFRCIEIATKKIYLVSPLGEVALVE